MQDEIASHHAKQRGDEGKSRQFAGRIGFDQPKPDQKRQSDHPDRLIGQQGQRQRAGNPGQGLAPAPGREPKNRNRHRHLIAQGFLGRDPKQRRALDHQRGGRPQRPAAHDQEVAEQHPGVDIGLRNADRQRHAGKAQGQPAPLRRAQPLAEKLVGAERHKKRRGVEKHHRARGRGQLQALKQQHEFEAEQQPREQADAQRAVAFEHLDAAQPGDQQQHRQRAGGTDRRLQHRRHVRQCQLDRDLVETPAQAQHQHPCDGGRGQRTPGRRVHFI